MAEEEFIPSPTFRVAAPKPRMTIYYALLILALLAMLTACLFLYLEIRRFGGFGTVPQRIAWLEQSKNLVHQDGKRMTNDQNPMTNG
jgi:hypothetical protein